MGEGVEFDDGTVRFVGEIAADLVEFLDSRDEFISGMAVPRALGGFEAEGF